MAKYGGLNICGVKGECGEKSELKWYKKRINVEKKARKNRYLFYII